MIELECKKLLFFSPQDEASFFVRAESIPGVVKIWGKGSSIFIGVKSRRLSDSSLRELLALFKRYRVSMRQLAQFQSAGNTAWFAEPKKYWFKSVFGSRPTKRSIRMRVTTARGG